MTTGSTGSGTRIIKNSNGEPQVLFNTRNFHSKARNMQPQEIGHMVSKILDASNNGDEAVLSQSPYSDVLGTSDDLQTKR